MQIVGYVLACRSYSFVCTVHHLIIIIVQTYLKTLNLPVRNILSSVWVRLSIFSQLSIIQYVGLCIFSLPISFVVIERIYILCIIIIIKSEVWTITHCLGLGHETIVCTVCLSIFLSYHHEIFRNSHMAMKWCTKLYVAKERCPNIFSCNQAALQMVFSVCPSVCLSHLFDYVPIILSSWNFQELLPMTKVRSMQKVKVKGQGHRGHNPT